MLKQMICLLLLLAGVALGDPVISPIIVTDMPAGTYSFPIAPVMNAGHTRNDCCYYHSEHTANTTGDSNIALCSSAYQWTVSAAASTQHASIVVYRLEAFGGGDPAGVDAALAATPTTVSVDGIPWYSMTCGAMDPGSWCYGNVDSLAYNTLYVAMLNTAIPDPDDASYPDDTITAVYGQGAKTKRYCASGSYDEGTGALTCTDNFLLYGWVSGDRILIQHADINSGTPTWTTVSSKTSKDAVVVAAGLAAGPIASGVKIYTHVDPYFDNRPAWSFPDAAYTYIKTDDRDNASSTTIPTLTWDKWVAAPLLESNGFSTRTEDYSLTIHDDVNGISSSALTGTYTDDFFSGARHIFISTSLGTDVGSCLTTNSPTACTEVSPCQTWACGISQLCRTSGSAVLHVRQAETYDLTADVSFVSGDTDRKHVDGTTYGSGADPIIETSPSGIDYLGITGTTTNFSMKNIRFQRTGACSAGCSFLVSPSLIKGLVYRCYFGHGGGNTTVALDGNHIAWLDNEAEISGAGGQFALFSMGGDGLTAHSTRNRAFIGNENLANDASDAIMRVRMHESIVAYQHNEVVTDAADTTFAPLRIAQDNYPAYQQHVANNLLKRSGGVSTGGYCFNFSIQSGGRSDWFLAENNELVVHSGDVTQTGFAIGNVGMTHITLRNNVGINLAKFVEMGTGTDFDTSGNTHYSPSTSDVFFIRTSSGNGYVNMWSINNITSAPNRNTSLYGIQNTGANATITNTHVHKTLFNFQGVAGLIRVATTSYSPASYETARAGLDVVGGAGASAVDPLFADVTTFDMRLCAGADTPVVGCALSPAIDAGFADTGLYSSFDGTVRPSGAAYDIGAFETDTVTGSCCACNGDCTDGITESSCTSLGGEFTAAGVCAGDCPTGACCTTVEGNCSVITDFCCAASQWLTGDVCTDCEWKCCQRDGTCSEVTEAVCAAFTNETFTWGSTCGTCATVACCTDATTCEDLTAEACAAEGKLSGGGGSSCGVGDPCTALFPASTNGRKSLLGVGR